MSTIDVSIPGEALELSPYSPTRSTIAETPLGAEDLRRIEAYWRACNYLSLGMIYLRDNPLLT
jgi:xylulose-5-phosphate/fructose-6-phosphate phosphoketolase